MRISPSYIYRTLASFRTLSHTYTRTRFTNFYTIGTYTKRYVRYKFRQYMQKTNETTVVETNYGEVRGVKRISCLGDEFFSFEKVPFATPPLNELRFRDPIPPKPWTDVRDCTEEGPVPVQVNPLIQKLDGAEDCLYLNIYTKNLNPSKPLPVMVWIYGGGFVSGGATKNIYSPDYFMRKDIVFIALSYRLGALGFLSLEDPSLRVPGNAGLKDQTLGLKWVKENCAKFGGDPNNITVFGESAGAASTHYQMINENAKGLFHKAILMSGCSLTNWALVPPRNWAYRAAKQLGYDGDNNDQKVLQYLRSCKASDIALCQDKLILPEEKKNRILFPFGPVVEPYVTEQCVISKDPVQMMRNSWSNDIPLIIGGCSFEGLIAYPEVRRNPKILTDLGDCEHLVPLEVNPDRSSEECKNFGINLRNTYFGENGATKNSIMEYLQLLSHKLFWHGLHRTVLSRLKYSTSPTYLYRFDVDSPEHNLFRILLCGNRVRGTCHADDLSYTFVNALSVDLLKDSKEYTAMARMIGIFTSFAEAGDPNCDEISSLTWEPLPPNQRPLKCLNIADDIDVRELPEEKILEVWDSMYPDNVLF